MAYIRFVVNELDADSRRPLGVIQKGYDLLRSGELDEHEVEWFHSITRWLDGHLEPPKRFAKSRKRHAAPETVAWFKNSAQEHIGKMLELCSLLDSKGVPTKRLVSDQPGYVVYEDEHQVNVKPFKGEGF
jgi:hypothetical protein